MKYLFVALALTALLAAGLLRGLTAGFAQVEDDLLRLFGPGRTRRYCTEITGGGHWLKLACATTPGSWWQGGETRACTLTTDAALRPQSLELWSAADLDADGHLLAVEWTCLRAAPAVESPGQAVAELPPTHVDADADAYRVVVRYHDREPWSQGACRLGLTFDEVE